MENENTITPNGFAVGIEDSVTTVTFESGERCWRLVGREIQKLRLLFPFRSCLKEVIS